MREMFIAGQRIADDTDAWIICEMGHNHQGSVATAMQMIKAAADAGVSAVKLQKRTNARLFTAAAYHAPYTSENSFGPTYGEHRAYLEFGWDAYRELKEYAASLGVPLFATAFDEWACDFLVRLGVPAIKVASGDLRSTPLLRHIAATGLPVILSTGGGTMADVERAVESVPWADGQLCLLQCTASYPCDPAEMNLNVITTYRQRFPDMVIGLSDHFSGISLGPAAFVLGARVMEKHFTLNRAMRGSDHAFSLEPAGLRKLVRDLQRTRLALGDGAKRPFASEEAGVRKMSKSLVAARALPAGHVLTAGDLAMKSPGGGLPPYLLDDLLGCRLARAVDEDAPLTWADVLVGDTEYAGVRA